MQRQAVEVEYTAPALNGSGADSRYTETFSGVDDVRVHRGAVILGKEDEWVVTFPLRRVIKVRTYKEDE